MHFTGSGFCLKLRGICSTSAAKSTGNSCAMSWRDSTIIALVSVCHRGSYAETYSRYMRRAILKSLRRCVLRVLSCSYRLLRKIGCAIGLTNIFTRSKSENDLSATENIIDTHLSVV